MDVPIDRSMDALAVLVERTAITDRLDTRLANSPATITDLPYEILALVFQAGHIAQAPRHSPPFELLVAGVTQRWRRVAFQTPQLWTRIRCRIHPLEESEALDAYLRRSAPYPLEIVLTVDGETLPRAASDAQQLAPYRQAIQRCFRLLVDFNFDRAATGNSDVMPRFDAFFQPMAAPLLSSFEHDSSGVGRVKWERFPMEAPTFEAGAPLLQSVRLLDPYPYNPVPPLARCSVLHMSLREPRINSILRLGYRIPLEISAIHPLTTAHSLVHLELDIFYRPHDSDYPRGWFDPAALVDIPLLSTLSITSYTGDPEIFSYLLRSISAPALQALCMRGYENGALPISKYPALHTLIWLGKGADQPYLPHNMRRVLRAFPSVERVVYGGPYDDSFIDHLLQKTNMGFRWPQLRVVALRHTALASNASNAHTGDDIEALAACRKEEMPSFKVVFLAPDLAQPWGSADRPHYDAALPGVKAYLGALDAVEEGG
ncbi:hypothetical protein FIBSPDRAFT_846251 [Athelia psychrophila]|uniref:Uncharacterized protein n=1 Tax=Athelia psychrophila TaxID=1759441 RepID=A0A166WVI8_9AGAM|nr:hypothetical protein FIBSPDRAFT_846251 [Fibularhizoctonia sp. CBS 109695]